MAETRWPRCAECGHLAQDHGEEVGCGILKCACPKYRVPASTTTPEELQQNNAALNLFLMSSKMEEHVERYIRYLHTAEEILKEDHEKWDVLLDDISDARQDAKNLRFELVNIIKKTRP